MTRRHVTFVCEDSRLVGTLDEGAEGQGTGDQGTGDQGRPATGLLLVSGGNELRAGAWAGQAQLAARLAAAGFAVFRFDRRGIGDSAGGNGGFRTSAADIAAALAAFRAECPHLTRIVGLGNCDAASALMLARGAGLDALLLCNPWTLEDADAGPPPDVIRDHYRRRLADPRALLRLLTGKVSFGRLLGALRSAARPAPPPGSLAQDMAAGIAGFRGEIRFLIAARDRTALAFLAAWQGLGNTSDPRLRRCPDATHSFVESEAREWLAGQVMEVLRG